jgi:hypothetical protein
MEMSGNSVVTRLVQRGPFGEYIFAVVAFQDEESVIDRSPRTFAYSPPLMKDGSRDTTLHQWSVNHAFLQIQDIFLSD